MGGLRKVFDPQAIVESSDKSMILAIYGDKERKLLDFLPTIMRHSRGEMEILKHWQDWFDSREPPVPWATTHFHGDRHGGEVVCLWKEDVGEW